MPYLIHKHHFEGFNTASGMRSHVTPAALPDLLKLSEFQYRKRYEVTCDNENNIKINFHFDVSIPQAV